MPEERTEITKEEAVEKAKAKLAAERDKEENKYLAGPVVAHLLKRIEEDPGLAEDIIQKHKTWEKCLKFINGKAREKLKNKNGYIDDPTVYEWSEDYYRKDDKAEEEKKAREEAERKKKREAEAAERKKKAEAAKKKKAADAKKQARALILQSEEKPDEGSSEKPVQKPAPKKNKNEIEGQMDFFSLLGA